MTVAAGDSGSASTNVTSLGTSGTLNVSIGDVVLVVVSVDNGPQTVSSLTDNAGNSYTGDASNPQSVTGQNVYVYRSVITVAKTGLVITAAFSAGAPACIGAAQITGRSGSPFLVRAALTEGAAVTSHTSAATGTIAAGCDVVALFADSAFFDSGTSETYTAGGSWTLLSAGTVTTGNLTPTCGILYLNNVGSTASQTATWTNNTHTLTAASVILALSAAAGGDTLMGQICL